MRLDEWQRYIDSEFVRDSAAAASSPHNGGASAAVLDLRPVPDAEVPKDADSEPVVSATEPGATEEAALDVSGSDESQTFDPVAADPPPLGAAVDGDHNPSLSPEPAPDRLGLRDRSDSHSTESKVAPFAEYIAVRHKSGLIEAGADSIVLAAGAAVPGDRSQDTSKIREHSADTVSISETDRIARSSLPLKLTEETAARLETLSTAKLPGTDTVAEANREELLCRLRDPILTVEETAVLLGVSIPSIRKFVDRGSLVSYTPLADTEVTDSKSARDLRPRQFRLSDILSWLAANGAQLNP